MQARVALVLEVGVSQPAGVRADDALHEGQVVEEDGAPETEGDVNPGEIS